MTALTEPVLRNPWRGAVLVVLAAGLAGCSGPSAGSAGAPSVTSPAQVKASRAAAAAGAGSAGGASAAAAQPGQPGQGADGPSPDRPPARAAGNPTVPQAVTGYAYTTASRAGATAAARLRQQLPTVVSGVTVRGVLLDGDRVADVVLAGYPKKLASSPMFRLQTVNSALAAVTGTKADSPRFETYGESAVQVVTSPLAAVGWSDDHGLVVVLADGGSLDDLRTFAQRYPRPE